jgi:enoyl-CoA hydratase/carnithine racemase
LLFNALDIPVPVVAAVNGPVTAHSELVLMSDIVLCSDETYFQDIAHVPNGLVPGDGVQIIWPLVVGHSRSRYFLLTGEKIDAAAALALGVVGEVLPAAQLMDRAMFHANTLAAMSPTMLRHTRQVLVRPLREALTRDLNAGIGMEALASLTDAANANPN